MHVFWVQYFEYFFSLLLLCELISLFIFICNAIKVYREWVLCVCKSSNFLLIVLDFADVFA